MKKRVLSVLLMVTLVITMAFSPTMNNVDYVYASTNVVSVVASAEQSFAIEADGRLISFGRNLGSQLGVGGGFFVETPTFVMHDVRKIASAPGHNLVIRTDGSLWAFGVNDYGHLGDGTTSTQSRPVHVMDGVIYAAAGSRYSLVVKEDGSLWGIGRNHHGQLGDGTTNNRRAFVHIMDDVASVYAGEHHSFAIRTDGSLWAFGQNSGGQLGDGTTDSRHTPVKIMENVRTVVAGSWTSFAIRTDESLWAWGHNGQGQLGDGTTTNSLTPIKVAENVKAVAAGDLHSLFLHADGTLWASGQNRYGQLGDGTNETRIEPVQIMTNVASVAAGRAHSVVAGTDGSLWTFGQNEFSQLGDGTRVNRNSPIAIVGAPAESDTAIRVTLDGRTLQLDQPPIIESGRTLVPIRAVAEAIGAVVEWEASTQTVTLERAGVTVLLTIGSQTAYVNGARQTLDVAPVIIGGRTLLPLRFVAETFSQDVQWDSRDRVVSISEDMSFARDDSNIQYWILGTSAVMAQINRQNPTRIGMNERSASAVRSARAVLAGSWGTTSREELLMTIFSIANYGHSHMFDRDVALFKSLSQAEQQQVLRDAQGVDAFMWPYVLYLNEKWGEQSIRAWDWFRVGHLVSWGYMAGYITLEEAFILFEPTAINLRETFSSWDEATENWLDGFAFWGRIDVREENNERDRRMGLYEGLKAREVRENIVIFNHSVWEEPVRGAR